MSDADTFRSRWYAVCDRYEVVGHDGLTRPEQVWVDTRSLIDSIQNGGLISYFCNSGADDIASCRRALRELDADDVLMQLDRLARLFGDPVPATLEARNDVVDAWGEDGIQGDLVDEVDEILMPKMAELEQKLRGYLLATGMLPIS